MSRFVLKGRSWLTIVALVNGTANVFGMSADGTLTNSRNKELDLATIAGLIDGTYQTTTVARYGTDQRASFTVGKANYGNVKSFHGTTWNMFDLITRHPNGTPEMRAEAIRLIKDRYTSN